MKPGREGLSVENPTFEADEGVITKDTKEKEVTTRDGDEPVYRNCGWLWFEPLFLQRFRTAKWVLFWLCWAAAVQGMLVNGFVNVVITTIEKRFGLNSFQTGLIASGYDVASFMCLIPVTYLGGRAKSSKPKWVGFGVLVMGLGALVFSLPHFLTGPYRVPAVQPNICQRIGNVSNFRAECQNEQKTDEEAHISSNAAMWIFFLGQFLHGVGATPIFTLGVTFIDENISKKMSSVYLGIYYTTAIVGPAMGYVLGGQMLRIYTDFLRADVTDLGLTSSSSVWVGAWWIGFVIALLICVFISIPILAFPPLMPGAIELQRARESEAHAAGETAPPTAFTKIKEIPKACKALMVNPTFFCLNMAGASEGLLLAGFAAFLPKIIENQFNVTASWAAIVMGIITVPAGGGGTYLGGYLVKKYHLKCSGIIKLCVYATVVAVFFTVSFFISCPNVAFAGVNRNYASAYNGTSKPIKLDDPCNSRCSCSTHKFEPVCGSDNMMYYSPCYAGCKEERLVENFKTYTDCTCIHHRISNTDYEAVNTMCGGSCNKMWIFVALSFGTLFFTFLSTMPALTATLRCVRDDQRSFALGIQLLKVRFLGTIPSPLIFGMLIDRTCVLWHSSCDESGACLVYDNWYLSRYMLGIAFVGKAFSLMFFFLSYWLYKPPQQNSQGNDT